MGCSNQTESGPAGKPDSLRKRNILFAGDNARALQDVERLLSPMRLDWQMVFASNPVSIKELLQARGYDAIVASMETPGKSLDLLNDVALRFPRTIRFVRGDPENRELLMNYIESPPVILAKEWDAETFASNVERAFLLKALTGSESLQKLVSRMEHLPGLPVLYTQVMAELAKPEASLQFIGRLIAKDPAMTAKILQMSNSTFFALSVEITDPADAVLYLGVERTKSLILLANVVLQFDKSSCPGFSHEQLWRHSMAVGAFARGVTLAQTKDMDLAEMAFTAGLLHDIGKLLLAANLPKIYGQVLEQAKARQVSVREVELETFDASHAELGAAVLGAWGLPMPILEAIAWHHCPEKSRDKTFSLLTAVHVANAVEREKALHQAGNLAAQIDASYIGRLGLSDRQKEWRETCGLEVQIPSDPPKQSAPQPQAVAA